MKIGDKIRKVRKEKKMTLRALSEASGVALATLSRIENNKMTGTVKSHQAIASGLGLILPQLYEDMEIGKSLVDFQPRQNRTDVFIHNDKASYDMLTSNVLSKKMMPVMLKIAPGGETAVESLPKNTEKFIYIIKGRCKVSVGPEAYILKKGQTLYLNASLRHHLKNAGTEETQAICIITPPAL
ncbi:MAG: helix-turn-helix transcriptional regulator [Candidatus Omnitrophica bacterium]|nr:helix-turn-helix transcriptional regulator [Candidatus Omnitrophota bacterium]